MEIIYYKIISFHNPRKKSWQQWHSLLCFKFKMTKWEKELTLDTLTRTWYVKIIKTCSYLLNMNFLLVENWKSSVCRMKCSNLYKFIVKLQQIPETKQFLTSFALIRFWFSVYFSNETWLKTKLGVRKMVNFFGKYDSLPVAD